MHFEIVVNNEHQRVTARSGIRQVAIRFELASATPPGLRHILVLMALGTLVQ
jgi:hypothetical protein